jgi:hypothetical protein
MNTRRGLTKANLVTTRLGEPDEWAVAASRRCRGAPGHLIDSRTGAIATIEPARGGIDTRAQSPWDFSIEQTFTVSGTSLRLDQRVTNRSGSAMPFGFGFHPYFFVPDAAKPGTTIATRATRAFDNVTKQTPTGSSGRWPAETSCASSHGPARAMRSTPASGCSCSRRWRRARCRSRSSREIVVVPGQALACQVGRGAVTRPAPTA